MGVVMAGLLSSAVAFAELTEKQRGALEIYNAGVEQFQLGELQRSKGNTRGQKTLLEAAIDKFEAALKQDPKLVEAQSNIGFAYLTLGDERRAIDAFEKALTINDKHLNTMNGLGTTYALDNKPEKAADIFRRLAKLDPGNTQVFFNLGSVLHKAGQLEPARSAYTEALAIDPDNQRAMFNLGVLSEAANKPDEARQWYEKAKSAQVDSPVGIEAIRRLRSLDAATASEQPSSKGRVKS